MDEFLHIAEHVLEHSVADTLYLIPFLLVTYLAMEWLEHKTGNKTQEAIRRAGAAGPLVGSLLGAVPQCGFSAMAATLYAGRVITLGTLFAVLLSTSDEMLPIFLAEAVPLQTIASILGAKIIIGMIMGFVVDALLRVARREHTELKIHELCEHDHCGCHEDCETCEQHPSLVYEHHDAVRQCQSEACIHGHHHHGAPVAGPTDPSLTTAEVKAAVQQEVAATDAADLAEATEEHAHGCCGHDHGHEVGWKGIWKSALIHTVQVTLFVFLITIVLNGILEVVGEDTLGDFLGANPTLSVLASALVGLIPNCAASVVIAQLYVEGVLGAGAMLAGLLVSAGVGLLVLARANRHWKQNVAIIVALYAIGVFWGLATNLVGITF